jgi:hypothetical protein
MIGTLHSSGINYGCPVNWASPLNHSLVSWWLCLPNWMGGFTFRDLCGRNHGTLTNMDPPSDWVSNSRLGSYGALDFDGTDDYVAIPSLLWGDSAGAVTVSSWARSFSGSATRAVWRSLNASINNWGLYQSGTTWQFYNGAMRNSGITADSTWRNLVLVQPPTSGNQILYVDGVATVNFARSTLGTSIGYLGGDQFGQYTLGQIGEFAIWNRAMSAAEVVQLYQERLAGNPSTLNRIRRPWAFDMGIGGGGGGNGGARRRRALICGAAA